MENAPEPSSKALKVFDSNGQELGLFTRAAGGVYIYNDDIKRIIKVDENEGIKPDKNFDIYYETNDCTGTEYFQGGGNQSDLVVYELFDGSFAIINDNILPHIINRQSILQSDNCILAPGTPEVRKIERITLPFDPVVLPLELRIE